MTKFKVGDVVTPSPREDGFLHDYLVRSGKYTVVKCGKWTIDVEGVFNGGDGVGWDTNWFELAEEQAPTSTAESLQETIFSIRQEREQMLSKLEDLDVQEAEAISQLNALGFSLFEGGSVDIKKDMTNPRNWEVGDLLECQESGTLYVVGFKSDDKITYELQGGGAFTGGWMPLTKEEDISWLKDHYKFHSRPVK